MRTQPTGSNRMTRWITGWTGAAALVVAALAPAAGAAVAPVADDAAAAKPKWEIIKPTNTGIPGDYVYSVAVDDRDRPWVTADDPIWDEGGLGVDVGDRWKQWTNVDGKAPTHLMQDLTFDETGQAWMSSDVGLLTYERGKVRKVWSRENAPWPSSSVTDFDWDSKGNLWVSLSEVTTVRGGVARYNGRSWKVWTTANGLPWDAPWDQVSTLEIDDQDRVWVGSPVMGAAMFDGRTWEWLGGDTGWVRDITIAPDGTPWFGMISQGVRTWEDGAWVDRTGDWGTLDVSLVEIDREGRVWIGTFIGSVWRWSGTGSGWDRRLVAPSLSHIYGLAFDSANRAHIGGIGGLDVQEASGGWSVSTTSNTALPSRWVDHVMVDSTGDGWFSTAGGGIGVYDGKRWTDYNPDNWGTAPWPFQTDSSTSSVQAPDGTVWVAPTNHGVGEWDGERWTAHLPWWSIESLTVDLSGDVWAAPDRGEVQRWDGTRWTGMDNPTGEADLNHVAADSSGNVWLASAIGLSRWNGRSWKTFTPENSDLPAQYVYTVTPEPSGDAVWVGTEGGLARFDGTDWTVYTEADGLPADLVQTVAVAPDGAVWVGAFDGVHWPYHGGVGVLDGGRWTAYTTENSPLPHEQVEAITVGPDGRVWIGTASEGAAIVTP